VGIHLWPFIGISLLVILAPGPDTVLVTKNAVIHGRGAALERRWASIPAC
jgi:threonine/homoserine/homoserine lactone efflux protein